MRIAHVIHTYYPILGGIERAVQHLAENQAKFGHEVTAITSSVGVGSRPKKEMINDVRVIRLKSMKFLYNDLIIPLEAPRINDIDIFHAHCQTSLFSVLLAEKLKRKLGTPLVFYFMAVDSLKNHPTLLVRLLGSRYQRRNTCKVLEICDLALVKGLHDKEILKKRYGVKAEYLPDGIPEYYFRVPLGNIEEFKKLFNITQKNIFLFLGRIHRLKGPDIFVKAIALLDRDDVAGILIGPDGGYSRKVLELVERLGVKERVYLLGFVDEGKKIQAIDSSIALVVPSITDYAETYSMVVSEAWARNKPVIVTSIGGMPYRVKDNVNGFIVEPLDPESLARVMLRLLQDQMLAEKMGSKGGGKVFSWTEIAARSIELYEQIYKGL